MEHRDQRDICLTCESGIRLLVTVTRVDVMRARCIISRETV